MFFGSIQFKPSSRADTSGWRNDTQPDDAVRQHDLEVVFVLREGHPKRQEGADSDSEQDSSRQSMNFL